MFKITDFSIEYQKSPLGLDEPKPRFSWLMSSDKNNTIQTAYQLIVKAEDCIVWDTGEQGTDQSVHIEYDGKALNPQAIYSVFLKVWDNNGRCAESSLKFETGLMGKSLKGDFISCEFVSKEVCPLFFTSFNLNKKIKRARLYATALGVYEAQINGKRVGDFYDAPFWTSYHNRLQYQTYDVTDLLKEDNTIQLIVANGWYKGEMGFMKQRNLYGDRTAVCADLYIQYIDGTEDYLSTNSSWKARESQVRKSEFFDGEIIDTTFTTDKEFAVEIIDYDKSKIVGQINEPVKVTEIVSAKKLLKSPKGETIIDFGQNLTGVVRFKYKGAKGDCITICHAEVLDKEGNFYVENLRSAKCEDSYILDGSTQVLQPHFTFRGFRYIRLNGFNDLIDMSDFNALVLHSNMKKTGSFVTDDKNVLQLQSNIVWGQRGNFFDIPTDCPQRNERLGWTGDAQVFSATAAFNYNVALFFTKWLGDLKLEQTKENGVPHVIPNILGKADGAACWSDAATIIPWTMYSVYGDKRILQRQYESMKDWVEYIRSKSPNNLWQTGFQYGDWLALDKEESSDRTGATDKYLVATAFYAHSTKILIDTAKVLNKEADVKEYSTLHESIVAAYQKEYITATGRLVSETQTACVLTLMFNLAPEQFKKRIIDTLVTNLAEHKNHLTTGFAGTPYICNTLSDNNLHEIAGILLLNEDYPSWLYQVNRGATTIWERWNGILPDGSFYEPGMNSFNHYAYGSIGEFLYKKVAGINALEAGYKQILIKPKLTKGLQSVRAEFDSVYGKIVSGYKCRDGKINIEIEIPVNTTAQVHLPEKNEIITLGSGQYRFEYETLTDLRIPKYSFESTLERIMAQPKALDMLNNLMPGFAENPMIEFAMKLTLNEIVAQGGEQSRALFAPVIEMLNSI